MSLIEIEDSAGGIQAEVIDKIFDQYFSTKDSADGTGLGLDLSKTIIEQKCRGSIEVKNGELGARFTLTVPNLEHRGD
jgi:signal transduction histidine kinase